MEKIEEEIEKEEENVLEQPEEEVKKPKKGKSKKNKGRIVLNIITSILAIIVVLEAIVGIINMQRINNEEKPIWYLDKKIVESPNKTTTEYNLGLYKIVKTDTARESKTELKAFFLK